MGGRARKNMDAISGHCYFSPVRHCPQKCSFPLSHAGNRGSTPLGDANVFNELVETRFSFSNFSPISGVQQWASSLSVLIACALGARFEPTRCPASLGVIPLEGPWRWFGVCSCHKRGLRVVSYRVTSTRARARRPAPGGLPGTCSKRATPGPRRRRLARPGQARGGGFPQGLGSHRGVRMGPGVLPMGGCIFGCRRDCPSRDIPADGTLVSVSKIACKVVGSSRRKFDRALQSGKWKKDFPPHRTGKVARLMPAS